MDETLQETELNIPATTKPWPHSTIISVLNGTTFMSHDTKGSYTWGSFLWALVGGSILFMFLLMSLMMFFRCHELFIPLKPEDETTDLDEHVKKLAIPMESPLENKTEGHQHMAIHQDPETNSSETLGDKEETSERASESQC
eukprot:617388_1